MGDLMKKLLFYILVPVILGGIVGLLNNFNSQDIIMPFFTPPGIVFPIVWTILYILMGISRYMIYLNGDNEKAVKLYNTQLIFNLLWSFIFFTFKWYVIAFIWILLLIYFVIKMILEFYKYSKTSAYLQLPYLLWLSYATILNLAVVILN